MNSIENLKLFKSFLRRIQYSVSLVAIIAYSCTDSIVFLSKTSGTESMGVHFFSVVAGFVMSFLLTAGIIETGMWLIDKANSKNEEDGDE